MELTYFLRLTALRPRTARYFFHNGHLSPTPIQKPEASLMIGYSARAQRLLTCTLPSFDLSILGHRARNPPTRLFFARAQPLASTTKLVAPAIGAALHSHPAVTAMCCAIIVRIDLAPDFTGFSDDGLRLVFNAPRNFASAAANGPEVCPQISLIIWSTCLVCKEILGELYRLFAQSPVDRSEF